MELSLTLIYQEGPVFGSDARCLSPQTTVVPVQLPVLKPEKTKQFPEWFYQRLEKLPRTHDYYSFNMSAYIMRTY